MDEDEDGYITCRRRDDDSAVSWGMSPQGQIVCDLYVWLFATGVRYYVTVRLHFHYLPFRVCFQERQLKISVIS